MQTLLDNKLLFTRKLKFGVAYHSPYMNAVESQFRSLIKDLEPGAPIGGCTEMLFSVTGKMIKGKDLSGADYWVRNMVSPVRFTDAVSMMVSQTPIYSKKLGFHRSATAIRVLLELGPHSALQGPLRGISASTKNSEITYISALVRHTSALTTSLEMAGSFFSLGCPLNLYCHSKVGYEGHRRTVCLIQPFQLSFQQCA